MKRTLAQRIRRVLIMVGIAGGLFVTLPASSASADICNPGEIWCMPDAAVQVGDPDVCDSNMALQTVFNAVPVTSCTSSSDANDTNWWLPSTSNGIPILGDAFARMTQMLQNDAQWLLEFVLIHQLSGESTDMSPILVCSEAQGSQKDACTGRSEWFASQFALMRQVAIWVVVPLFFIMVIQSVIKGSLYNLLRHALVMFPLAVIGTAIIIVFMQMFLNITDDLCNYIVNRATQGLAVDTCQDANGNTVTSTTCGFKNSLTERSIGSSGSLVAFIWLFILIAACIAIYLELLGRQIGVYAMTLMLPLVMAGLVWSRSIGIAKKLFQFELALIISKVFIVAAVSLGMGALSQSQTTTCNNDPETGITTCGDTDDQAALAAAGAGVGDSVAGNDGFQALAAGTLIIMLAAFAGSKVITLSPAAMAGQHPVWNKGALAARGQVIAVIGQRAIQYMDHRNRNKKPDLDFNSNGVGNGKWVPPDPNNDPLVPKALPGGPGSSGDPASAPVAPPAGGPGARGPIFPAPPVPSGPQRGKRRQSGQPVADPSGSTDRYVQPDVVEGEVLPASTADEAIRPKPSKRPKSKRPKPEEALSEEARRKREQQRAMFQRYRPGSTNSPPPAPPPRRNDE